MNVCVLDHPRIFSAERFNDIAGTPLWSCLLSGYAAASLKAAGHAVEWLDAAGERLDFYATRLRLSQLSPELVAIHAVYFGAHTPQLLEFISDLKAEHASVHICLFGFFPSLAAEQLLERCPAVDAICIGECEQTLVQLAGALSADRDWRLVSGLAFLRDGRSCFPAPRPAAGNPDVFPAPLRRAGEPVGPADRAMVLSSRGCFRDCAFCPIPPFDSRGPNWCGRSPENVLDELQGLVNQGYRRVCFVDPNFIGPGTAGRQRVLDLMAGIKSLGIRFGINTWPDDLTADLMAGMVDAGLDRMTLCIESDRFTGLDRSAYLKTAVAVRQGVGLCRSAGIEPEVGFFMHSPDSTLDDLAGKLEFLIDCRLLERLDRTADLLRHRRIVFLGTRGFERYQQENRIVGMDPLGFEAQIAWRDPRARWVADVTVPVCLEVLRAMGDRRSPLNREAAANRLLAKRVNADLVAMFRGVLHRAAQDALMPVAEAARQARQRVFYDLGPPARASEADASFIPALDNPGT